MTGHTHRTRDHTARRIPPNILFLPAGGLIGRTEPSPCAPLILATAPPILTPGLITPDSPAELVDPPRFGFSGDILPGPPILPPRLFLGPFDIDFFFIVADFGICPLAPSVPVGGAMLNV